MAVSAGCSIVSTRANGTMRNIATRRLACSLAYGGGPEGAAHCPRRRRPAQLIPSPPRVASRPSRERPASRTPLPALSCPRPSPPRRGGCQPRLEIMPPLPLVQLQAERHVERLAQPVLRDLIGPLEADRRQDPRAVVEREPQ